MTSRQLLGAVLRRWYLMVLGAAATVGVTLLSTNQPGVYWTDVDVVLLAPATRTYTNNLENSRQALAPLAGVLVRDWNGTQDPMITATGTTTLFGQGDRVGVQVRLPNQGSQFKPLYTSANINVQVVGSDAAQVSLEAQRVAADLAARLDQRQASSGIRPSHRVTTLSAPTVPTVFYVSGHRPRAALAVGVAGAASTTIAVYWLDVWWTRRRSPARAASETPLPVG